MERHQTGQEETLVKVRMETDSLEFFQRPRGLPADCRFKCAVVVIVALVAAFILYFFTFMPSRNQDTSPLSETAELNISSISYKLKDCNEKRRCDIFTVNKSGSYLIYGWVKFSNVIKEKVTLKMWKHEKEEASPIDRTLGVKDVNKTECEDREIFFFESAKLVEGTTISIYFESTYTDSLFHAYKL